MLAWESGPGELVLLHHRPRQALSWAWALALSQVSAGHVTRCPLGTLQSGASPRQVGDGNELTGTTSTSGPLPSTGQYLGATPSAHSLLALRWAPVIRPVQKEVFLVSCSRGTERSSVLQVCTAPTMRTAQPVAVPLGDRSDTLRDPSP